MVETKTGDKPSEKMKFSIRRRLVSGAGWMLVGSATVQGLGVISSIILARILGKDKFGEYGIALSTVATFGIFAGLGMGVTTTRFVAELRERDPARAGRFIGMSMVLSAVFSCLMASALIVFAQPIATSFFKRPDLASLLCWSAPLLIVSQLTTVQLASLSGLESFRTQSTVQVVSGIIRAVFVVGAAWLWGVIGTVMGLVAATLVQAIALEIAIWKATRLKGIKIRFTGFRTERRVLFTFSLPAMLASISVGPPRWLCEMLLVRQTGGLGQMALMNAGNQWRSAVAFIPQQLLAVTLPVMSALYGARDTRRYYKTLFAGLLGVTGASLLATMPIIILGRHIMAAYGPGFRDGYWTLVCLSGAGVLHMTGRMMVQSAHARGTVSLDLASSIVRGTVQIGLWLLWLPHGALGLSGAILTSYVVIDALLLAAILRQRSLDVKAVADIPVSACAGPGVAR